MRPSKCKDLRFYGPVQKTLRNLNSLSPLTWPFICLYLSLTKPGLFSQPLNLFVETRRGLEILVENMPVIFYASLQSFISPYDLACQTCFSNVNHLIFEVGPCFRKKWGRKNDVQNSIGLFRGGQTFLKHGLIFKYQPQGWEIIPYLCKVWMNNAKTFGLLGRGRFPKWLFTITKWLLCASHVGKWNCVNSDLKGEDKTNGIRNLVVAV